MAFFGDKRFGILFVSIALGLVAAFIVHIYIRARITAVSGGKLIPIIVSATKIPAKTILTEDMLAVRNVPQAYLNLEAIGQEYKTFILSQKTCVDINKGQPILWPDIYLEELADLSNKLDINERAIAINVDMESGINGLIRPGDKVDVLCSFNIPGEDFKSTKFVTKMLLQNAAVLAVGSEMIRPEYHFERAIDKKHAEEEAPRPTTITLKVSPEEAAMLTFVQQKGEIRFILRSREDIIIKDINEVFFKDIVAFSGIEMSERRQKKAGYPTLYKEGTKTRSAFWPDSESGEKIKPIIPDVKQKMQKDAERKILEEE